MAIKLRTCLITAGGVLLVVFIVLVILSNRRSPMSPVVMELARVVMVRNGLGAYAQEHDGKFPRTLGELLPEYADFFPPNSRQFHDPVTKRAADWIYYGSYTRVTDDTHVLPPGDIILASPSLVEGHKRIVVYADTSAGIIEENDFALHLSRQLNDRMPPPIPRK